MIHCSNIQLLPALAGYTWTSEPRVAKFDMERTLGGGWIF